ncbi:caspase family protein [Deinococcus roseus]|uniref:Caspase family p20 domain-containing protein n=1 Tax=Deinococcus roseus TaxID=392414 RepID=A0ABQ2D0R9_9DEIO|nr:caspase family protein [Deinococcus roseus]GGJ36166.1 hypothetical protein GCM10008938_22850 [Deinococcus roseus]
MKRILTLTLSVLLLGFAGASNRALMVNISAYQDPTLDLPGNAHNVPLVTSLSQALGFQPADLQVLQNGQATREGVLNLLQDWTKQVQLQDQVLVYLSGRGTRLPVTGEGGVQLCQDVLVLPDQQTLPIQEVRRVLQQMPAGKVMLVLDTAFGDPLRRAVGILSMADEQPRSQFKPPLPGQPTCKAAETSSPSPVADPVAYLELGAASPQQTSWSTAHGGLFSRSLTEVVLQNPQITFEDLQPRVNNLMQRFTEQYGLPAQNPMLVLPAAWQNQSVRQPRLLTRTPMLQRTLKGHPDEVYAVAFSPDGKILAYTVDRYLFLAESGTGKVLRVLAGHSEEVDAVAFSPDGKQVLTGSSDRTAQLWDVQTGTHLKTFTGHRLAVEAVAFSPDGKQVLTGSSDRTAQLWDAQTGTSLKTFGGHDSRVFSVVFSPDGKQVLTTSDHVAHLWNAGTGAPLKTFIGHTDFVFAAVFSPDGKQVLTGSRDSTARLWDAATGAALKTFAGHTGVVYSVGFSPDGKQVLTAGEDHTVQLWDAVTGAALRVFAGHTGAVYSAAFSPDGKQVLTGSEDTTAQLWNADTGTSVNTLLGHKSAVNALGLGPDGRQLITASGLTALVWNTGTSTPFKTLSGHAGTVSWVGFSPDGKQVLTAGDYTLRLWDAQSGAALKTFAGHSDLISAATFSPDGKFLLSGSKDTTARLWSVNTRETLKIFAGHKQPITSVAFSPDGKQVLTGSEDSTARLWSVGTGETLKIFSGHTRPVRVVAFSPDGKQVLTGSEDRTLRIWNAQTGQQMAAYGVSSPHFRMGKNGTVLAHQDCMSLQHIQPSTGTVLNEFPLGDRCFGNFVVSDDGRTLITDSGQIQDASTLSVFGFADPTQGFFQDSAQATLSAPQQPADPILNTQATAPTKGLEKRVALVIGNANYQNASLLENPLRDAKLIAQQLKQAGFEVLLASNVTKNSFDQVIRQFRQALSDADVGLLYYSGHGLQVSGVNRMVPVDAQLKALQDVDFETVTVDFVLDQMDQEYVRTKLIILDACRTNPFLKNTRDLKNDGLAAMKASRGTLIAFATAPGMPAADGSGLNSPYARALGKHLLTPGLTVEQVFKRVRQDVLTETAGEQEPWENSSLLTDLYFVP